MTVEVDDAVSTAVNGINNRGQAVGAYTDAAGTDHGFRWENGRITTIDIPRAANTVLIDINNRGQIVGTTTDAAGTSIRGFRWEDGRVTDIRVRGAAVTSPQRINDRGQIVGYTADDPDLTGAHGSCWPRVRTARRPRWTSPMRPGPRRPPSTIAERS